MAITMQISIPSTPEQYDQVNDEIDIENNWPDGLIVHTAAQVGDGMRIIDVWESADAFNTFNNGPLMKAVIEVMGEGGPPAQPEITELYNVLTP